MSTEPTTATTTTAVDAPVTATVDATPVAPAPEAAAVTEPAAVTEEPATTTETHVAEPAATTEEPAATTEAVPAPAASKSTTTSKRLSLLLGKAKTFVDKKVSDKKPAKKEATKEATEATETAEAPVAAAVEEPVAATSEEPAAVAAESTEAAAAVPASAAAATTSAEEAHVEKPKNEKRKSILGNIFRSKVIYYTIFIICRIRFNSFVVWSLNPSMGFSQRRFNISNAGVTHWGSYLLWFQPILKLYHGLLWSTFQSFIVQ